MSSSMIGKFCFFLTMFLIMKDSNKCVFNAMYMEECQGGTLLRDYYSLSNGQLENLNFQP